MEINFNIRDFKKIEESYNEFKSDIEKLKDLLKANKKYKNLYEIFSELRNKNIYAYFILFKNFENWINVIFENNNNIGKIKKIDKLLNYIKENKDINSNLLSNFIYWIFYLYTELVKNFSASLNPKYREINKIQYALEKTSYLIIYLYKQEIIKDSQIFDFLDLIFFFAESNFLQNSFSYKVQKGKGYILFSQLFFFLQEILVHINNKLFNSTLDNNKKDVSYKKVLAKFFKFLEEFKNNKNIISYHNKAVLINNNIILNFMNNIFKKTNLENLKQLEPNLKKNLGEFYLEFIKHNFKRSKIYDSVFYFLRQSFINLYNFDENKNKIIQDLFINSFYSSFLNKLFFRKDILDECIKIPDFDCFYFNGYDSQISLNIQKNKFEKSSLFLSFNLTPIKEQDKYTLLLIQNFEKKKDDVLKIYLKKDEKENAFYLWEFHQKDETKLDYKISGNTTYYLCICFNDDQLLIKIYEQNKEIFSSPSIKKSSKLLSISSLSINFGYYKKKTEVFSGFIGPIMIISNPKQSKMINDFITSVLLLGKKYINYIPLCLDLDFIEEDDVIFKTKNIQTVNYKLDKLECLLYLIPKNFIFFNEKSSMEKRLPIADNFCNIQDNYIIQNFNVSLIKYEKGIYAFVKDNGLDYICLLYEYIYQFSEHFFNSGIYEEKNIKKEINHYMKYIIIIFKETLKIIEKIYNEIKIENFFKNLKQIYMNLFSCLQIITNHSNIINDLINPIFDIMNYYHTYFTQFETFKLKANFNQNSNIFETNLAFMNGFIYFLLNPEIYYNFETKNTLILLFNQLSKYFNYISANKPGDNANKIIYNKLVNFINKLYEHYNSGDDFKLDNNIGDREKNKNIINFEEDENNILNASLDCLKSFFDNNPSKIENMNNLKNMFKSINENLSEDDKSFYVFSKFINKCINKNVDIYFTDDKNEDQISALIKVTNKLISSKALIKSSNQNNKENSNKSQIFDELICDITSILMRILLSKEKISKNITIVKEFIIKNVEITNNLIPTIFKELKMIFTKYILTSNVENIDKKDKKNISNEKAYSEENIDLTSKFYKEALNVIKFVLEDVKENDKNAINNENVILEFFEYVAKIMRVQIDENNITKNSDSSNNSDINNENNNINYVDILICLINFLKFYYYIFSRRIYSERFVNNFIEICNICYNSGLIYSTILIEFEENSDKRKTTLEIILDTCIYYIYSSSNKFLEESLQNDIDKAGISNAQTSIYNFILKLWPEEKSNSKDTTKSYTIFYINDYFRYFSFTLAKEGKKKLRKDQMYNEFISEFTNLQNIDELFSKEKRFNLNFSTFFIIKCNGYKQLLFNLFIKISDENEKIKRFLKLDDLMPLITYIIRDDYSEQELLHSKYKNFFFPKTLNTPFIQYLELKKQIEIGFKKKDNNYFRDIDDVFLSKIFKEDNEKVFSLIYSGLCISKKEEKLEQPKERKSIKHHLSVNFNRDNLDLNNNLAKTYTNNDSARKKLLSSSTNEDQEIESTSEINTPKTKDDDDEYTLQILEMNSSEKDKNNLNEEYSTNELTGSFSISDKKLNKKKKFSSSSVNSFNNTLTFRKTSTQSFISSNSNDSNFACAIFELNYFFKPDKYLLKNSKKQIMMSIFSIYFFDYFFHNKSFMLLKNYYLQNYNGIQKSTKLLNYPTKIKIFNNGLEPYLFFKPYVTFFDRKFFSITHKYFIDYINDKKIDINEPIILYKKELPEFDLENKFDLNCELIKLDHCHYGHIIGSKKVDYIIFEKQKYDFYEEIDEYNKNKNSIELEKNTLNTSKLFTLTYVNKKPLTKSSKKNLPILGKPKKFKRNKVVIILFDEIQEIVERRFLLMWQGIEIFLKNGKSYFFNLLSKEQNTIILDIFKNNEKTKNKVHTKNYFQPIVKKLISEWQEEQINTYEYILFLNKYATRTYNDVNQYPVFPWVIRKFESIKGTKESKPIIRNFKFPMAAQNEENREAALARYKDDEGIGEEFPIHYGTHYSTSSYIYFYLMREEPFTNLLIKLQGNKQENPDRMFYSMSDTLLILETGHDNRECIPDLLCKIEQFINLNCVNFEKKNSGIRIDDFNIYIYDDENEVDKNILLNYNNYSISDYVNFILKENSFLNSKKIANEIINWFDIIFGVGQLPEKNLQNCLNIFSKESYEQKTNLNKMLEELKKENSDLSSVISTLDNKIDLMISFGQTPYQIFEEKHPKFKEKKKVEKEIEDNDEFGGDFEKDLEELLFPKYFKKKISFQPVFFQIYPSSGKIFLIDINRKLEIMNTNFYDSEATEFKEGNIFATLQLPHISFFDKRKIEIKNNVYYYYILKQKYCISLFTDKISFNEKELNSSDNSFNLYYNTYLNNISNHKEIKVPKKEKTPKKEEIIFITCRYSDNSFKIHCVTNDKQKKEEKYFSVICEDFVCSVCTLDHNKFLVGLKNGKLIQCSLSKKNLEGDGYQLNVKFDKQIQAHKKAINVIEVDYRLGIIITAGEDHYLFIRKIYDLELITPIKIKSKFLITMARVSPLNFLYVQCFNMKKNSSIIFGYTLNGIYFAKSKYAFYDSLDFTRSGNVVTFVDKSRIEILNGNDLKNKDNINKKEKTNDKSGKIWEITKTKIFGSLWANFNYISRRNELDKNTIKCVTFAHICSEKKNMINLLESANVTDLNIFE